MEVGRFSSVFWSNGYDHEMVIRPNFLPSRVFYRRVKNRGFFSSLKGKFTMKKNVLVSTVVLLVASVGSASAAVDAGVTTALGTAATDGATIGGAVLAVIVGIAAFKYLRRAL